MALTDNEKSLLDELLMKFGAYKKLTPKQELLVTLGKRNNRNDSDDKKLSALLSVEKKRLALLAQEKAVNDLLNAEKKSERAKYDNATYQLGGLFRAMLKNNNPEFVKAFKQAVQGEKIKTKYTDDTPLYSEYEDLLMTPTPSQSSPKAPQSSQNPFMPNNTIPRPNA